MLSGIKSGQTDYAFFDGHLPREMHVCRSECTKITEKKIGKEKRSKNGGNYQQKRADLV